MKKIVALLMTVVFLSGFTFKASSASRYTTLGDYIYNLVKTTGIQINFFVAPKVKSYFGDIKDSDYYAMAFINAAVAGILDFPKTKIYPQHSIKIGYAKVLMDKAYYFKTKQNKISDVVFNELYKNAKYKKMRDNNYLTKDMQKDMLAIYARKLAEFKNKQEAQNSQIKIIKTVQDGSIVVTLDWGQKPTGGYDIQIYGARVIGYTIEVLYGKRSPGRGEIVPMHVTNPRDSIRISVGDINKDYRVTPVEKPYVNTDDVKFISLVKEKGIELSLDWGEKPTGGYSVKILNVLKHDDIIEIGYTTKSPQPEDMVTQAVTYPRDKIDISLENPGKDYNIAINDLNLKKAEITPSAEIINNYMLVTLSWGEKPTGGYEIKILNAKQIGDTIEVRFTLKNPGPEENVIQMITYPKDSIAVSVDDTGREYGIIMIDDTAPGN